MIQTLRSDVVRMREESGAAKIGAPTSIFAPATIAPAREGRFPWSALAVAAGMHAAVFGALLGEPADRLAGTYGQQLDAISVTIVNSNVLQTLSSMDTPSSSLPPLAPLETVEGSLEAAFPAAKAKSPVTEETSKLASPPALASEAASGEAPAEVAELQSSESSSTPATKGGVIALAETADLPPQSSPPAAASPGAVREYARYVSQALAKTRPMGAGRAGTVKVRLEIAPGGKLAGAEIAKSSGNRRLDDTALDAVRRTMFPTPPTGMSSAQLTYEVPYHFR